MNFSNYRLSLDIHETESGLSLRAKKGDTIRKIYVTLMDGGTPYRITPDCTAAFTARKPDNTILFNEAAIENNAIVYTLTPQTTASAGQIRCEVRLYGGDGRLITSPRFFLDVDDTVFTEGDEVVSEDEYTILEDAIGKVDQAVRDFEDLIASGHFTDLVSQAFLHKTGGTMSGQIDMDGNRVTGLGAPVDAGDAASKGYVDSKRKTFTAMIGTDWEGDAAPYAQSVSIPGILETDMPHITPAYSADQTTALVQREAWAMISYADVAEGSISFECLEDKPSTAIPIQIEVMR